MGLASLYGTTPRNLLTPEAIGRLTPTERAALAGPASAQPPLTVHRASPQVRGPGTGQIPPNGSEPVTASHQSSAFLAAWQSSDVGAVALDQIQADLSRLAYDYMQSSLPRTFLELVLVRDRLFDLLSARRRVRDMRALLGSAAISLTLLARVTDDLGLAQPAERHAQVARALADESGDPHLVAWTLATQSSLAYWQSRPQRSIDLAEQGLRIGDGHLTDRLLALKARSWA